MQLETDAISTDAKIRTVITYIRNREAMDVVFKTYKPHVVFHAAAYKHAPLMEDNPCQAIFTNIKGTKNLADLACAYNVKKFVMGKPVKIIDLARKMIKLAGFMPERDIKIQVVV